MSHRPAGKPLSAGSVRSFDLLHRNMATESVHGKTPRPLSLCTSKGSQVLRRSWYSATFSDLEDDSEDLVELDGSPKQVVERRNHRETEISQSSEIASEVSTNAASDDEAEKHFYESDGEGDEVYVASNAPQYSCEAAYLSLRSTSFFEGRLQTSMISSEKLNSLVDNLACANAPQPREPRRAGVSLDTSRWNEEDLILMQERRLLKRQRQRQERREQRRAIRRDRIGLDDACANIGEDMAMQERRLLKRQRQRQIRREQRRDDRANKS